VTAAGGSRLVTDERGELRAALRRLAAQRGRTPAATTYVGGGLDVVPRPVAHTSHPTYGYAIRAGSRLVVWAPEFWTFPEWAAGADLMFAEPPAGTGRSVSAVVRAGTRPCCVPPPTPRRPAYAGWCTRTSAGPSLRAIDAGLVPPGGEWGEPGRTYRLPVRDSGR